jgi:hypothetical protein
MTGESAYTPEIKRDEINWLDIPPFKLVVPPLIPPPLTTMGAVPSIFVE